MENSTKILLGSIIGGLLIVVGLVVFLKPEPEPVELPIDVTKYSDLECGACAIAHPVVQQMKQEFGDKINYEYKHFPLTQIHPRAIPAAVASEAAREQGKFDEFIDLVFNNQQSLSDEDFFGHAETLELDIEKFKEDYENNQELKDRVSADQTEGEELGVNSTPTFYVEGKQVNTTNLIAQVEKLIERAEAQESTDSNNSMEDESTMDETEEMEDEQMDSSSNSEEEAEKTEE